MIRHIVFFRLAETLPAEEKTELLNIVKQKLEALPALIPEIRFFEIGINLNGDDKAADLSLLSEFDSMEALQAYQVHSAHRDFIAWNRGKCPKLSVVDYEF
ncbi:MAG: Dabb family protein [Lentimicrobium sp.]